MRGSMPQSAKARLDRGAGRRLIAGAAAVIAACALDGASDRLTAATAGPAVEPFAQFLQDLATAPTAAYVGHPGAAVGSEAALEEMRQHLLKLYAGVAVEHSFALDGQVFDCVPVEQQPSVRLLGLTAIAAPPPSPAAAPRDQTPFGASSQCDDGTIPMRRITLAEMSRFKTLQDFFAKGPDGAGRAPVAMPQLRRGNHGYAYGSAVIDNYGGYSALSIWDPEVITGAPKHEIFSLAQHWYVGGINSGPRSAQTAEVGWQNYPRKYHTSESVLFIYWTADDYHRTGCYNLDCVAFVQTDNSVALGGVFGSNYSQAGGSQYALGIGYYLYQGNWWLEIDGTMVGYYPGSIYRGGQLSQYAQIFELGGETVGFPYWPGMGSGNFAAAGYGEAAYHAAIAYRDADDGLHAPSLTVSQPSPSCWTATSSPAPGNAEWGTYFYFGGPGGKVGVC
jgi:hypothetical protein